MKGFETMQGKEPVLCTVELGQSIELLTKGALIDLVVDLARRSIGEHSTEEELAEIIEAWSGPVLTARDDRPAKIVKQLHKLRHERGIV